MAYARFSYSDVYVFFHVAGFLECCGCSLGDRWAFHSTQDMVDHLAEHRAAGHQVPDGIEAELWEDDRHNWVDYPRCDLDGCDRRAGCGSPTQDPRVPSGYVSACSIEHAQRLGGFADVPPLDDADAAHELALFDELMATGGAPAPAPATHLIENPEAEA